MAGSRYFVGQLELCPTTGKLHVQWYVAYESQRSFTKMRKLVEGSHVEKRGTRSSPQAASDYCKKEDRGAVPGSMVETGVLPAQGSRSDIDDSVALIQQGMNMRDIAAAHPASYVRNYRGFQALRLMLQPDRTELTRGLVYWGPSGSGKSYHVKELFGGPDCFTISCSMIGSTVWWDGYDGQSTVVFEDFFPASVPFTLFINMIDCTPLRVQTKGNSVNFCPTRVVFTSNLDPSTWYQALRARRPTVGASYTRRLLEYMDVFYVGYGPLMDLPYCPCSLPSERCPKQHKPPPESAAFATGLVLAPARVASKRITRSKTTMPPPSGPPAIFKRRRTN